MKHILVLGCGLVARPLVRYLLDASGIKITVACLEQERAEAMINGHEDGEAVLLDISDKKATEKLIEKSDVVVSLLPYTLHLDVAKLCIKNGKHMVTTSYVSPAMKELDEEAKSKGVLLINELGVDPGIDHMSALKVIHDVRRKGGKIISFKSITGGLPAPEDDDNPFGYKFSWSPRGVLLAGRNPARYLDEGKNIEIEGKELFAHHWEKEVDGLGTLEVYPNRDSMKYQSLYGLDYVDTLFRGTFRNTGWCDTLYCIAKLGWLNDEENKNLEGKSFREISAELADTKADDDVRQQTAVKCGVKRDSEIMERLDWIGLFTDDEADTTKPTLLDILTARMLEKMPYQKDEKDMIVMQHDFIAEYPDRKEEICSLLIEYGEPGGDSAMAKTVSLPAAIAARCLAEGRIDITGVHIPNKPEVYEPIMDELEKMGIKFKEKQRPCE